MRSEAISRLCTSSREPWWLPNADSARGEPVARYGRLFTEALWEKSRPLFTKRPPPLRGGKPPEEGRKVLEGIFRSGQLRLQILQFGCSRVLPGRQVQEPIPGPAKPRTREALERRLHTRPGPRCRCSRGSKQGDGNSFPDLRKLLWRRRCG